MDYFDIIFFFSFDFIDGDTANFNLVNFIELDLKFKLFISSKI